MNTLKSVYLEVNLALRLEREAKALDLPLSQYLSAIIADPDARAAARKRVRVNRKEVPA